MQDITPEAAKAYFRQKDRSRDGYLDVYEVEDLFRELSKQYKIKFSEKRIVAFIKKYDKNRDGKISEDEFLSALIKPKLEDNLKSQLRSIFKKIDKDNNGYLDYYELTSAIQEAGKAKGITYTKAQLDGFFRYYDINGDGKISIDEFFALNNTGD